MVVLLVLATGVCSHLDLVRYKCCRKHTEMSGKDQKSQGNTIMLFVKSESNNAFVECVWQKEEHAIHT